MLVIIIISTMTNNRTYKVPLREVPTNDVLSLDIEKKNYLTTSK